MKRALIVKLGAIGDVVMVVPAAHALHEQGYTIDWVCGQAVASLLRCYSWINVLVADDTALLQGSLPARLRALIQLWRSLKTERYDLVATLYYNRHLRLLTLPVRAHRRVALSVKDRQFRILPGRPHAGEFLRILCDLPDDHREAPVALCRPDALPTPICPPSKGRRIGIIPGGASNMVRQQTLRRWPVEQYLEVASAFLGRGDEVLLLGGPTDTWVRERFLGLAAHPRLMDRIGETTLPEMISTCDTCDLVISHDTGPLHLAGLSRAALLALFGPTDPSSFLPRREGVRVLWGGEAMPCRPCYDGRDFATCQSNVCMQSVSTATVLATAEDLLASGVAPAAAAGVPR